MPRGGAEKPKTEKQKDGKTETQIRVRRVKVLCINSIFDLCWVMTSDKMGTNRVLAADVDF